MLKVLLPDHIAPAWLAEIKRIAPNVPISTTNETKDDAAVTFVLAWQHQKGSFARFPHLKAVMSFGAGYDHILNDPSLPKDVPVARVVDDSLSSMMAEYVLLAVATQRRHWLKMLAQQHAAVWQRDPYLALDESHIGVLGLGPIGQTIANKLKAFGYQVSGWSRTHKTLSDIQTFAGNENLSAFLAKLDFLVCVLPQAAETVGFINYELLMQLPAHAYVINICRGGLLVEADLLRVLDQGHLAGACLDVFSQEPLPEDSPIWSHPKILVTPHIAGLPSPRHIVKLVMENYRRSEGGEKLLNCVR